MVCRTDIYDGYLSEIYGVSASDFSEYTCLMDKGEEGLSQVNSLWIADKEDKFLQFCAVVLTDGS